MLLPDEVLKPLALLRITMAELLSTCSKSIASQISTLTRNEAELVDSHASAILDIEFLKQHGEDFLFAQVHREYGAIRHNVDPRHGAGMEQAGSNAGGRQGTRGTLLD